jgi:quercetin dioxygenase-like cupin family protein
MNSLTQFKKTSILPLLIALIAVGAFTATPARATPACNVDSVTLAVGHYPSGLLDLGCEIDNWELEMKVKGDSDVYVTQHTFPTGAHTGWHTHPGPSLITVISGELTVYDGATCTSTTYTAGQSFTDIGCGDVHLVRNEGSVVAVDIAVQIVPKDAPRRIDMPAPGNCPTINCP